MLFLMVKVPENMEYLCLECGYFHYTVQSLYMHVASHNLSSLHCLFMYNMMPLEMFFSVRAVLFTTLIPGPAKHLCQLRVGQKTGLTRKIAFLRHRDY